MAAVSVLAVTAEIFLPFLGHTPATRLCQIPAVSTFVHSVGLHVCLLVNTFG